MNHWRPQKFSEVFCYTKNMAEDKVDKPKSRGPYKIVGRDPRVDLSRYAVTVHGRQVIDYQKLKLEDPELYEEILNNEKEWDLLDSIR